MHAGGTRVRSIFCCVWIRRRAACGILSVTEAIATRIWAVRAAPQKIFESPAPRGPPRGAYLVRASLSYSAPSDPAQMPPLRPSPLLSRRQSGQSQSLSLKWRS